MRQLEADWQRQLGKQRFADLNAALRELTGFGSSPSPSSS
jgi:hypothetical protein